MDALMNIKYDPVLAKQLAEILLSDELTIVWGLFLSSTPKDVEPIASIILKFFDENKKVMYLMKQAVTNEIRSTSTTATLFRLNNFASKLLSSYSKRFGLAFIKIILNDIIGDLCISHKNDPDYSFEVDPDKLIGKENLRQTNLNNLLTTTQKLIDAITGASASIPIAFRSMCVHLKHETEQKFPGEYPRTTYASVGGFIFLRYICPAIVVPQKYGLLEIAPGPNINRDLLLLSKVVQTIANGATFGSKEPYLMELNPFLEQNQEQILHFLDDLSSEENLVNSDLNGAADFRNSSEIEINNNDDVEREIVVDQNQIIALLQYLGVYWQKMKNAIPQMEDSLTTKHLEDYIQMCVILNRFGIVADSKQKSLQKEIAAIDKKVQKKKAKEEKKRIQKESKDLRKNLKLGSDLTVKKQNAWDANSVIDLIRSKSSNSKKSQESPV